MLLYLKDISPNQIATSNHILGILTGVPFKMPTTTAHVFARSLCLQDLDETKPNEKKCSGNVYQFPKSGSKKTRNKTTKSTIITKNSKLEFSTLLGPL